MIWGRLLFLLTMLTASPVWANDDAEYAIGGHVSFGYEAQYYNCPCLRWNVQVKLLDGRIETRELVISTDALFQVDQAYLTQFKQAPDEIFRIGAVEALAKNLHIGLGFDGLTIGAERDKLITDIIRTGVYGLINVIRTDAFRLDLRTEYDFESFMVYGKREKRHRLGESLSLRWRAWRFDGDLSARVSQDLDAIEPAYFVSTRAQIRAFTVKGLSVSPGIQASYEHDPFRELYGLIPNAAVGGIYIDVSYLPFGNRTW